MDVKGGTFIMILISESESVKLSLQMANIL